MSAQPSPASPLAELERLERRIELVLRDLRIYRATQQSAASSRGVLGSRGLTEFIMEMLQQKTGSSNNPTVNIGYPVAVILRAAETAGYAIPTARTLGKRLAERQYRVGDIAWAKDRGWYWKGYPSGKVGDQ